MENELTSEEKKKAEGVKVWIVWYEYRFGSGEDRDPASPVTAFLTKKEAKDYIDKDMGPVDINSGKFDGLFTQEWEFLSALKYEVMKIERARELLLQIKD